MKCLALGHGIQHQRVENKLGIKKVIVGVGSGLSEVCTRRLYACYDFAASKVPVRYMKEDEELW